MNREEWQTEVKYCETILQTENPSWKLTYLRMQVNRARRDGFEDLANRMSKLLNNRR